MADAGGQRAHGGRRRPRIAFWVVACLVVLGAVLALVGSRGGGSSSVASGDPACTPSSPRTNQCPHNASFDAKGYVAHGDAFDCETFASQADAQAVLRANPRDPDRLDPDRDGVACPQLPAPKDLRAVASIVAGFTCRRTDRRSARCPQPWRHFDPAGYVHYDADEFDCSQFASQADAQAVLRLTPSDPNKLDGARTGIACPSLPAPKDLRPVVRSAPS